MKVVLPWPDKRLSPNARGHWGGKVTVVKKARADACKATYAVLSRGAKETRQAYAGSCPITVRVTFYPPDNRRRDVDNLIASMKAAFDGIADALAVDDNRFRPSFDVGEVRKGGDVEVVL